MAQLKDLKDELNTISDLKSITEAFEQSAASALRETRGKIIEGRQFAEETWRLYRLLRSFIPEVVDANKRVLVVIVTINEGMTGGLLNRVVSEGLQKAEEKGADILITGRKGHNRLKGKYRKAVHYFSLPKKVRYESLEPLKQVLSQYVEIYVVFPRYYNAGSQRVESLRLSEPEIDTSTETNTARRFKVEPSPQLVLNYFNKEIMGIMVYAYFAESQLAYNAAQMMAMQRAKESAEKYQKTVFGRYNRTRREIADTKLREVAQSQSSKLN